MKRTPSRAERDQAAARARMQGTPVSAELRNALLSPNHNTVRSALAQLAQMVSDEELGELVAEPYARAQRQEPFDQFFEESQSRAGQALRAQRLAARDAELANTTYPFLFFGAQPGDWHEGDDEGHLYFLAFQQVLTAPDRLQLAALLRRERGDTPLAQVPWRWGELDGASWAWFKVSNLAFGRIDRLLKRVHEAFPVREVLFGSTIEDDEQDTWTQWSRRQPLAGHIALLDPWLDQRHQRYFEDREVVSVPGEVDPAFERAR